MINLFHPIPKNRVVWLILGGGLMLEMAQLLILIFFGPSMHSIDINDVLLNALGVWLGWLLYRLVFRGWSLEKLSGSTRQKQP